MKRSPRLANQVAEAANNLSKAVSRLDFSTRVPWVYNPLDYAWNAHEQYLHRYVSSRCQVVFLGMNPGPWGMAQTGVPFGEVQAVKNWLEIDAPIGQPNPEHPKRPVQGLACQRSEVSGRRLWGLFASRYANASEFFDRYFVANYCPLVFMESSGKNLTPDKLPVDCRQTLLKICDEHLSQLLELLQPEWLIGVGGWAESCGRRVVESHKLSGIRVGRVIHPSPASPAANRDWKATATEQLKDLGVWS